MFSQQLAKILHATLAILNVRPTKKKTNAILKTCTQIQIS